MKTTNDYEMRFSRMFLFILELLTQFLVVHKNHPRDFHMSLKTPSTKKSRAHGVNDCDLSDNLKQENLKNYYTEKKDLIESKKIICLNNFL